MVSDSQLTVKSNKAAKLISGEYHEFTVRIFTNTEKPFYVYLNDRIDNNCGDLISDASRFHLIASFEEPLQNVAEGNPTKLEFLKYRITITPKKDGAPAILKI